VNDIHVFGCLWPSHGDGEGTGYREVGDTHSNIGGTSEALSADINPSSGQSYYYSTDENVPSGGDRSDSVVCRHSCFGILIVAVFVSRSVGSGSIGRRSRVSGVEHARSGPSTGAAMSFADFSAIQTPSRRSRSKDSRSRHNSRSNVSVSSTFGGVSPRPLPSASGV
jgi:hypothetical protein